MDSDDCAIVAVVAHSHRHSPDKIRNNQELNSSSTSNPPLSASSTTKTQRQAQQQLPVPSAEVPALGKALAPPKIPTRNNGGYSESSTENAAVSPEPWQIRGLNSLLDDPSRQVPDIDQLIKDHIRRATLREKEAEKQRKQRKKSSFFLQQALAGTASFCKTPTKPRPVVVQEDPRDQATLLESGNHSDHGVRKLAFSPKKQRKRQSTTPPKQSDEARKALLNLDPQELAKELEAAAPQERSVHYTEFAKLFKESADPNIDTRDPDPHAAAPAPSPTKRRDYLSNRKRKSQPSKESSSSKKRSHRK